MAAREFVSSMRKSKKGSSETNRAYAKEVKYVRAGSAAELELTDDE